MHPPIEYNTLIHADPESIWQFLTVPELMKQWMAEPESGIEIYTDWVVGSPVRITGFHHIKFENKGIVLECTPYTSLSYSHLSSISRLPDTSENYSVISFNLQAAKEGTMLFVSLHNFPTESIFKHLDFYWRGTIMIIKELVEGQ